MSYKIDIVIAVLLTFASICWVLVVFVHPEAGKALSITASAVYAVCFAYLTLSVTVLLNKYVRDIKTVIASEKGRIGGEVRDVPLN